MGGFDATSHLLAGMLFQIPTRGTQAHSFIQSFSSFRDLKSRDLIAADGSKFDLVDAALAMRAKLPFARAAKDDELAAFICYAQSCAPPPPHTSPPARFLHYTCPPPPPLVTFPSDPPPVPRGFLCLVDTYDVLVSGVPNFLAVAAALHQAGYTPIGVRIDSGDLLGGEGGC